MADSNVPVTPGVGAFVDTRTAPDGDHRQVLVLGDGTGAQTAQVGVNGALSVKGSTIPNVSGTIAAGATGVVGPAAVDEAGNVTFWVKNAVASAAYTGSPVVAFDQSDDGVSWSPLAVVRNDNGAVGTTFTLAAGQPNASVVFNAALPGVAFVRVRVSTAPQTAGLSIVIDPGGLAFQPLLSVQQATPRSPAAFYTAVATANTATEALLSLTSLRSGATVAASTTPAVVPAGRTLRLHRLEVTHVANATAGYTMARLRVNLAGAAALTSPVYRQVAIGAGTPATANSSGTVALDFGDGLDLPAGAGLALTTQGYSAAAAAAAGLVVAVLTGFEF